MAQAVTVTVELAPTDRALLEEVLEALRGAKTPAEVQIPTKAEKTATEAQEPAQEAPKSGCSMTDVQRKVVELSAAGKKAEVRDIIKSYAERVSAIPADKLDEVMEKLKELEG